MRLVKFAHACVRLESDDGVLVFDPGSFSDPSALDGADAVLVTHEHGDHLAVDSVVAAAKARPQLRIYTHAAVAPLLDAVADAVTTVDVDDEFEAAGHRVRAVGGTHARIHADVPAIPNLGYLVDGGAVYHPGDSFALPAGSTVDTLLVPISGPWLKVAESIDFTRAVAPRRAVAIHEALLSDVGLGSVDRLLGTLSGTGFERLPVGGETVLA